MENLEGVVSQPASESKMSNYKSYSVGLLWAGIIGFILTVIFYFYARNLGSNGLSGPWWENYTVNLVFYYLINSALILLSGILLINLKRAGVYVLITAVVSILGSLFVVDPPTSLFFYTIASSFFALPTGAPIMVLFFLGTVFTNIMRIKMWYRLTRY